MICDPHDPNLHPQQVEDVPLCETLHVDWPVVGLLIAAVCAVIGVVYAVLQVAG